MAAVLEREIGTTRTRNSGMPFDLAGARSVHVNRSAVERRAQTLVARRTVKKAWQTAWLLRAITCIDLTTLAGDDTPGTVKRLCAKAIRPVQTDIVEALDIETLHVQVAAVCVYHNLIPAAVEALQGSKIPVAAVSTGFPAGQISLADKMREIEASVNAGAQEIDIVISRSLALTGAWEDLYKEVRAFRAVCGPAHMKTILAAGELSTLSDVYTASMICMQAGADFIKTSTGKETTNATVPVGLAMVRAIRAYHEQTGVKIGFKPAGGIRTAKQALEWLILMKEELGIEWLDQRLFRLGASGLLTDIERQLSHAATGRYAASHHFPSP